MVDSRGRGGAGADVLFGTPRWDWTRLSGPLLTLVLAGGLLSLHAVSLHIPNPVLFFVNCIVLSAFVGGLSAGFASVGITIAFALVYWSLPQHLFRYAPRDVTRLIVLAATMPPLALLVGWLRSANDRKQLELASRNRQLAQELHRREELEARQRDVEHILRHDLRTPLSGIIGIPELLLGDDNLTSQQREMLLVLEAAGRKMLHQINSSLELHRIEEGIYTLQATACDPAALVRENFNILAVTGGEERPTLYIAQSKPIALRTDCRLLDVILANLLRNAVEANDPGRPIVVRIEREAEACLIAITNSQPVPESVRARFFEKYATAGKAGGTGLGTYSALLMTRALGGRLDMETGPTQGTTVTLRLPLSVEAAGARPAGAGSEAAVGETAGKTG